MAGPIATLVPGQRCCTASAKMRRRGRSTAGLGVADAQNPQVRAIGQRQAQVAELAVDLDRGSGVGQAGPDRPRGVQAARAVGKVECGAVGEDRLHSPACRYPGQVAC